MADTSFLPSSPQPPTRRSWPRFAVLGAATVFLLVAFCVLTLALLGGSTSTTAGAAGSTDAAMTSARAVDQRTTDELTRTHRQLVSRMGSIDQTRFDRDTAAMTTAVTGQLQPDQRLTGFDPMVMSVVNKVWSYTATVTLSGPGSATTTWLVTWNTSPDSAAPVDAVTAVAVPSSQSSPR